MRTANMCPTGPEFQALVNAVGKMEAMRDWMEHDGEVRTPEQVLSKLAAKRSFERPQDKLLRFLSEYGFEINEAQDLVINLANKTINLDTSNVEQVAKALAVPLTEMLSHRYFYQDIEKSVVNTGFYKKLYADLLKAHPLARKKDVKRLAVKQIMSMFLESGFSEALARELNIKKSLIDKIKAFIQKLIDALKGADFNTIQKRVNEIVENTFKGDDFIRMTPLEGFTLVDFQEAFDQNSIAKEIMTKIGTDPRLVLTGSIAMSTQGTVYRKIETVVHDLDFVNQGMTEEQIEQLIRSNFPDFIKAYKFKTADDIDVNTYVIPPKGLRITNLVRRAGDLSKIIYYDLVNEKGEKVGEYELLHDVTPEGYIVNERERHDGERALLVDFFSNGPQRDSFSYPFTGSDGKTYEVALSHFDAPFEKKLGLGLGRLKDIWDFNRFIPYGRKKYGKEKGLSINKKYAGKIVYATPGAGKSTLMRDDVNILDMDDMIASEMLRRHPEFKRKPGQSVQEFIFEYTKTFDDKKDINDIVLKIGRKNANAGLTVLTGSLALLPYADVIVSVDSSNPRILGRFRSADASSKFSSMERKAIDNLTTDGVKDVISLGYNEQEERYDNIEDEFYDENYTPNPENDTTESVSTYEASQLLPIVASVEATGTARANEIAEKLMAGLGSQTNVDYDVVTPQQAAEITAGSNNPYNGEDAFFFNGKAYFVKGKLNTLSVFHEFSHPVIRQLGKSNPKLFAKLYASLLMTPDGAAIANRVTKNYPELRPGSFDYMEEVIVTALSYASQRAYDQHEPSAGFKKIINEILYAIKQFFRKTFGQKVDVSKLNPDTTLEQLAQMLVKGEMFKIETEAVSDSDQVAYTRDQINQVNDMAKVSSERMSAMALKGFEIARRQIKLIRRNKNYREMLNILVDEFNRGDLQEISSDLRKHANVLENKMDNLLEDLDYKEGQAQQLVNTFYRLQKLFGKVEDHLKKMAADPNKNNKDNMQKAFYYNSLIKYWKGFLEQSLNELDSTPGIAKENELYQLVSGLDRSAENINKLVGGFYSEGVRDTLMENLLPMAINMKERFESIINTLRKGGASQSSIDRQFKEYYGMTEAEHKRFTELKSMKEAGNLPASLFSEFEKLRQMNFKGIELTEEKLEETLKGRLGDVFWANGYLEGVLYSDDPVVGGFGLYVSNAMNEVMNRAQMKYNIFADAIREDLKKVGYNPSNIGELGRRVGFVDNIGVYDPETDSVSEKKIWTFLNPWKDYRYAVDMLEDQIRQARKAYLQNDSEENKAALIAAMNKKREHDNRYMHQEMSPEYCQFRDRMMRDEVGKKAFFERDRILEDIRKLQETITTDSDLFKIQDQIDELWRQYKLLHSLYDRDGYKKKSGDPNPMKNLEVAQRLQDYSKGSRKFYKYVERPGYFDNALIKFKQSMLNRGLNPDDPNDLQAQLEMSRWLEKNMRVVIKPEFYEKRREILERISDIMNRYPERQADAEQITMAYDLIFDNVAAFRDQDNQPNGSLMSEGRIANVKAAQQFIDNLREEAKLGTYMQEEDVEDLMAAFDDLASLQTRKPTDYYMDQVNSFIRTTEFPLLRKEIGTNYLEKDMIDLIYQPEILEEMRRLSPDFDKWFQANHIEKTKRNSKGEYVTAYERIYVWNVIVPVDPDYYETYDIRDENGEVVQTINMVPSNSYYARVVKDEYKTGYDPATGKVKLEVGKHIDNKGNWLPRADVKDSPYRNEAYYEMQSKEPDLFNLLEKLKKFHLEHQKGLSGDAKLYLDFPRFEKTGLESIRTRNKTGDQEKNENWFQWLIRRIKDFFTGAKDMPESGFNYNDEYRLATLDLFDNETNKIPMQGLYDIDHMDVSTDITNGMLRYMLAAERNKKLVEINPTAQAIRAVLENNNLKNTNVVSRDAMVNRGEITYANSKEKYLRKHFVNALIEREFEGQNNIGFGSDSKILHNLSQSIFKTASLGFFALNIPSALKNAFGAKYQAMIEAAAGRYFNMKDFAAADAWAFKTMGEISMQIYKQGSKSKDVQIWEVFNPIQNLEQKFQKEGLSRSLAKDVANMSWLMNFRKWTEMQASMQIFGAYMKRQQVETKDGGKMDYLDAWEIRDGQLQLKDNVKPEWGITYDSEGKQIIGDKFKAKQQEIQAVMRNLQGAYDSFNQPEAQRLLMFRFISFLRRFFTTMLIDRFGFKWRKGVGMVARYQPGLGTATEGWYISIFKLMRDVMRSGPKRMVTLLPDERRALLKFATDVAALALMTWLQNLLFDWDPEDEDRYEKLRQRSGPMRGPFVADDQYEFNMSGWLTNHALNLLIQTQAEQKQFLPLPGMGLKEYMGMLDLTSIAFGPTLENYGKIFEQLGYLLFNDKRAYYKKEVGPYEWQQEEGMKLLKYMASGVGFTGTFWAPEVALQNYMSIQSKQ